jgi:hypothetical protein
MRQPSPRRLSWVELGCASVAAILFVVTALWKDWIEIVFGVDPDAGSGALEWLIPTLFLVVALVLSVSAGRRLHGRRVRARSSPSGDR